MDELARFPRIEPPTYCCSQAPRSTTERQPDIGLSFVFHLYTLFIETRNWPVMQKCNGKWIRYWATDGKEDRRSKADHQVIVKEAESCLAMQVRYPEEWMKQQLWRSLVIIGSLAQYTVSLSSCLKSLLNNIKSTADLTTRLVTLQGWANCWDQHRGRVGRL